MTSPLLALPDALRAAGLDVLEVDGWQTRARPGWFTPTGVLWHHTAGPIGRDMPSLRTCIEGRPKDNPPLRGPLCQVLIGRGGRVAVISAGRCNHAGEGGPLSNIPRDEGNQYLLGIELENNGVGEPWPDVQIAAAVTATAVILALLGQTPDRVWGHKEWTTRKPDPRGLHMPDIRARVAGTRGTDMPTTPENPYADVQREALQLLAEHAGYTGDRKWFGPDALAALHRLKNYATQMAEADRTSADTIARLIVARTEAQAERDTAVANREAAEAEAARLRLELQTGGRLPQLLADIDAAVAKARA